MTKNLKNLNPKQKDALINKLGLNLRRLPKHQNSQETNFKKPFGYYVPTGNFNKVESINYKPPPPGKYQIQIEAKAISLNFRDLMIALGLYPTEGNAPVAMGGDYSGVIVECGEDVSGFRVGDEVISLYGGDPEINLHFSNRINSYKFQTALKPKNLSFEEACSIPTVFLTAYHGLCNLGKLSKNEKVLIHTASGGVGLAAIQIAKWKKAHIFATAGTKYKRSFLRSMGIENVMDSRSLQFYDQILESTSGDGIDVILNTLAGEGMEKGIKLLRNFGRFVQIDKTDIYQGHLLDLQLLKKSITFSYLDLTMFYMDTKLREILENVCELFKQGTFTSLPIQVFSHSDVGDALNAMTKSSHVGKIVMSF